MKKFLMNLFNVQEKPKSYFQYQKGSNTIRLMPQNYLVAWGRYDGGKEFVADPDAAISDNVAAKIFLIIRHNKFAKHETIVNQLNTLLNEQQKKVYRQWIATYCWRF